VTQGSYTYPYPRPMVTVDAVVFAVRNAQLYVLLIKRGHPPFERMWALPGGFLDMDEELETAVARELLEETSVTGIRLEQFQTFGGLGRDPRGRVITIAYLGVADWRVCTPHARDDAADAAWHAVAGLPKLASDHNLIITHGVEYLRLILKGRPGDLGLLPETVSAEDLRQALMI
jgi:8-oxo-dGTP diphosphatase